MEIGLVVKQRLIFTLLFSDGYYMLSRNFRLQKVGDIQWLNKNYDFKNIATSIDELVILDVTRGNKNLMGFCENLKILCQQCFVPIAVGGGIRNLEEVAILLKSGADKIVVNTILYENPSLVKELVSIYGSQCVIASIDLKRKEGKLRAFVNNGSEEIFLQVNEYMRQVVAMGVGEIYLNSIDKDGTGQGYLMEMMDELDSTNMIPIILAGGAGNYQHFLEGLKRKNVDAVATAHLFNFVGDGLPISRTILIGKNIRLPIWDCNSFAGFKRGEI